MSVRGRGDASAGWRRAAGALALALVLMGPGAPARAQSLYDYASRTPGVDVFAYDGESATQLPATPGTPTNALDAAEYARIASDDGVFHAFGASTNNQYGQIRFEVRIDESEASVGRIDVTWNGFGVNQNNGRTDGASLYLWNYATASYELLQAGPDTEAEVTLTGSRTTNLVDYIGGAAQDTVVFLVVDNDRKTGAPKDNQLATDYVKLEVTSLVDHFVVIHDGFGIHCLAETVTVEARASDGSLVTDYTGAITLDTQTGKGTWSDTPGNAGSFADATPDDGRATYVFAAADAGRASFGLTYTSGAVPFDIDAFETATPALRDDDTEGLITFSPSGFTVTASPLANPPPNPIVDPIGTQTAGAPFLLHLTAYGQTATDPVCGVIESYTGARSLAFWSTHLDPALAVLAVTVDGSAIAASEAASVPRVVDFVNGQASVVAKYKDVGRIQIAMKDTSVPEPAGGIRGATNPFVVRPADFAVIAVERPDTSPNPGASTSAGAVFVAAGTPFRVSVEVRDAEGDPTPSYGLESTPEGIRLTASTLVAPAGGRNGSNDDGAIGNASAFAPSGPAGSFLGTTFYWDEVGAIRLQASVADGDYLGSGDVLGTESGIVGRFVPDHFDVAANAPSFETACPAGAFTYLGQDFDYVPGSEPVLTVTARNAQGTPTANYEGAWFRLTAASLAGIAYTSATGTLAPGAPDPPSVTDLGSGVGRIAFDNGPPLRFTRTVPVAAFDAEISLSVDVLDEDGVAYASNPARFGDATPGNGIAWSAGKSIRFGRLVLENAYGSELVTLPVPLRAEVFDGSIFVVHTDDACTALPVAELETTPVPATLTSVPSLANVPLAAGDAGLTLSPPGAGNTGYVDLRFDLSAVTGAALPWLRFDWDGDGAHDDDPTARATFGVYAGADEFIYLREVY